MILTKSCGQRDPLSEMDDVSRSVVMSLKQRIINHNFLMVNLENHGVDTVNDMALTSEANLNCACVCACVEREGLKPLSPWVLTYKVC